MRGATLNSAVLELAQLAAADLTDAHLRSAVLEFASLAGATLRDADLKRANLVGCCLVGADVERATFVQNYVFGVAAWGLRGKPREVRQDALRWLRRETIGRLNRGLDIDEILADIEYPADWAAKPWMAPTYGHPDFIVRDIYRSETGWWDRNIKSLHPASRPEVAEAIRVAISDPGHVIATAERLRSEDRPQLALHVIDLLAQSSSNDPEVLAARQLKKELAEDLAGQATSFISANLYRTLADYPHERAD